MAAPASLGAPVPLDLRPPLEVVHAWVGDGPTTYPRHEHPHMELVYHRRGTGFVHLADGRQLRFVPGTVVHCPAGCVHGEHQDGPGGLIVVQARWLARVPAAMREAWAGMGGNDPWLAGEFAWLAGAAERPAAAREAGFRLAAVLARLVAGAVEVPQALPRQADQRLALAERWIRTHHRHATVAGAAAAAGVCPDHLTRLFRAHHNFGPRFAIARARIEQAKHLLTATGDPLQDIAEAVGFTSARHFGQAFRRVAGTTPGQFRARGARSAG